MAEVEPGSQEHKHLARQRESPEGQTDTCCPEQQAICLGRGWGSQVRDLNQKVQPRLRTLGTQAHMPLENFIRQIVAPRRLLCPWDSPGKNTGMGCHFLLQGIFPTPGANPHISDISCISRQVRG